ncbi:MAG: hypothetical protein ACRDDY_00585 [Clostridium sp.]|uniref:hypothetical protein n=1 Tax=Clostridium sp. TaxID=1506 RepID=UPI003EE629D4
MSKFNLKYSSGNGIVKSLAGMKCYYKEELKYIKILQQQLNSIKGGYSEKSAINNYISGINSNGNRDIEKIDNFNRLFSELLKMAKENDKSLGKMKI